MIVRRGCQDASGWKGDPSAETSLPAQEAKLLHASPEGFMMSTLGVANVKLLMMMYLQEMGAQVSGMIRMAPLVTMLKF